MIKDRTLRRRNFSVMRQAKCGSAAQFRRCITVRAGSTAKFDGAPPSFCATAVRINYDGPDYEGQACPFYPTQPFPTQPYSTVLTVRGPDYDGPDYNGPDYGGSPCQERVSNS